MTLQVLLGFELKISVILVVFGFGLQATGEDVVYLLRRPALLLHSLVAMFLIMPLFAVFTITRFEFHKAVEITLVALSISPVPPLLPRRVTQSGGKTPYGLGLMVTAAVLSVAFIPLALELIAWYAGKAFAIHPAIIAKVIVMSVVVPLGAGMAFRKLAPQVATRIAKRVSIVALVLLLVGVLVLLVAIFPVAWSLVGNGTILIFAVFVTVGLAVGHFLGGPNPDERVTLALCTACRHPALALAIANANFPGEKRVAGAIILYLLLNMLVSLPYVAWQRRRAQAKANEARQGKTDLAA
jgi:BASS family bile acid:Na+ symporter